MATKIIGSDDNRTAFFDSVTDTAFGPLYEDESEAESFLVWLEESGHPDPRTLNVDELANLLDAYREETDEEGEDGEEEEEGE